MSKLTKEKLLFTAIFATVGLIAIQIPFTRVIGSDVSFTLFDFFGPIAGAFLGPILGILSVFSVLITNFIIKDGAVETASIIRLFPMLFAAYYFATIANKKTGKYILAVPIVAMLAFWAHPIGREVWYYALFWTIPVFAYFKRDWLISRSLGATFTAHAVGGVAFLWALNLPAVVWQSLIPIVIVERGLFALGIAGSYIVTTYTLKFLIAKKLLPSLPSLDLSLKS